MKQPLRCACAKSKTLPWCDGSHAGEDWACEPASENNIQLAFCGSGNLQNLLKRLAWRFNGETLSLNHGQQGQQLIIIEDGSSLPQLAGIDKQQFKQQFFIGIDFPTERIAQQFSFDQHAQINDDSKGELSKLFGQLETLIDHWINGKSLPSQTPHISPYRCKALNHVFISHAVADEQLLLPMVESMRQTTQLDFFLCFDSINQGEKWRRTINSALDKSELFVFIVSKDSVKSTYCAFETGCALTQGKHICLISIDGSLPPAYISHLHCIDLQREINAKPWLDLNSALISKILAFTEQVCLVE